MFPQALFVEKEDGQSKYIHTGASDPSCEFYSWNLKASNICAFSRSSSGNYNLFVLMLFPLGPALIIPEFWFIIFCHLPCHIIIIFSCNAFLVSSFGHFGTFLVSDCKCLRTSAESEKIISRTSVTAHQT